MKKMIITIIFILLLTPILIYIGGKLYFSETKLFKLNWGIDIPASFKVSYKIKEIGFHGDGDRYTVFRIKDENLSFINSFGVEKNIEIETFVREVLDSLKVPMEYRISFNQYYIWWKEYKYKDGSTLVIIYFPNPDINQIYFIERIM
ncbi:hypothetical protein [Anaerovorax sp. IOR16]|uniref:hypothetical protein n=1 Tax=Anaerovorax sp. IOR16 TaxID=2773458 RepID=UPI0019D2B988|nr:hypothetical protein [Anaerovorax sp. IOR16]